MADTDENTTLHPIMKKWYNRILDFKINNPLEYEEMEIKTVLGIIGFIIKFPNNYKLECCYDGEDGAIYLGVYSNHYRCLLAVMDKLGQFHFRDTASDKPFHIDKYAHKNKEYWWVYDMLKVLIKFNIVKEINPSYNHKYLKLEACL